MSQKPYKPHYYQLKDAWNKRHQKLQQNLWDKHKETFDWLHATSKNAMLGSMAGLLLLAHPVTGSVIAQQIPQEKKPADAEEKPVRTKEKLMAELQSVLPETVQPLTSEQESSIGNILSQNFNVKVAPELEGIRLNRSYGLIGAEQHLMRYPGDIMETHFSTPEESKYYSSGMAPGRGAWGYFAQSRDAMTQKDIEREKYYIAVPTFLSPGWSANVSKYYNFYKYRKMLVVNAENGKAMVVVIGDAGPAEFTGKHLGGSPEVMNYLERVDGGAKGPVIYYFIDDPDDRIPLGPITIQ